MLYLSVFNRVLSLSPFLSLPPGANPPDSETSSPCPPNPAGLLGRLGSLTYSVTQGSLFLTSLSVPSTCDSARSALSLSFGL